MMMKLKVRYCLLVILLLPGIVQVKAQVLVESIAAIVGNEVIYLSDLENVVTDMRRQDQRTRVE